MKTQHWFSCGADIGVYEPLPSYLPEVCQSAECAEAMALEIAQLAEYQRLRDDDYASRKGQQWAGEPPVRPAPDVPANCRQRMVHSGKPYPRSSCQSCGPLSPRWRECDAALGKLSAGLGAWVPMHERVPEPDTTCVVWLRYDLHGAGFAGIDEWRMHREDPTGMSGPTIEMGYDWADNDCNDVIAWIALPAPPPKDWDQRPAWTD